MNETTIYMTHRNPGASMPLTIPVHLLVNVSDEVIEANVRANAVRSNRRVKTTAPHDRVAVMVGSGPSLADHLDAVRALRAAGDADVFAMNGAAQYLWDRDIAADYQVLVDARERTADLIAPARAHLIASQCDPICFERVPDATMWHFINGDLDSMLPADEPAHAQIGGAGSVGNCALALAWAMGYRRFEVFGYDSSHRANASHAFHQPLNDFEPWGRFQFNGRDYICSYTMRSQASRFQVIARELLRQGCTVTVHGDGLLPDMWRTPIAALSEREKYERMWDEPEYRSYSPGECAADVCLREMEPAGEIIDFGCGTGRGGLALSRAGLDVTLVDFAANCRDDEAKALPFVLADLTRSIDLDGPYGYCTDVMEHVPPSDVDRVIRNVMGAAETVFFQISTVPDECGALIGHDLHLTVQPHVWWLRKFEGLGYRVTWEQDHGIYSQFIVTR